MDRKGTDEINQEGNGVTILSYDGSNYELKRISRGKIAPPFSRRCDFQIPTSGMDMHTRITCRIHASVSFLSIFIIIFRILYIYRKRECSLKSIHLIQDIDWRCNRNVTLSFLLFFFFIYISFVLTLEEDLSNKFVRCLFFFFTNSSLRFSIMLLFITNTVEEEGGRFVSTWVGKRGEGVGRMEVR